jgi:twinkle protein
MRSVIVGMSKVIESKLPCPSCDSSDAFHVYDDGHGYCFSCQYFQPPEGGSDDSLYTYQYIPYRGVTEDTFRTYGVKFKIDSRGSPIAIGFSYPNGSHKIRLVSQKHFYWSGDHKAGLFGLDHFAAGSHKHVTITEGELDAISFHQVLKSPVVSVQSSSSAAADVGADHSWLSSFEKIYLAFDGDAPGREATARVAKLFDPNKVFHVRFTRPDRKDPNAYL